MDETGTLKFTFVKGSKARKKPRVFIAVRENPETHSFEIIVKNADRYHNPIYWTLIEKKEYPDKKVAIAWYEKTVKEWEEKNC